MDFLSSFCSFSGRFSRYSFNCFRSDSFSSSLKDGSNQRFVLIFLEGWIKPKEPCERTMFHCHPEIFPILWWLPKSWRIEHKGINIPSRLGVLNIWLRRLEKPYLTLENLIQLGWGVYIFKYTIHFINTLGEKIEEKMKVIAAQNSAIKNRLIFLLIFFVFPVFLCFVKIFIC